MEDTTHSQGGDERKCGRQYQTCPKSFMFDAA